PSVSLELPKARKSSAAKSLSTPATIRLFEGNYCRRAKTRFPALVSEVSNNGKEISGQEAHRHWHDEQDEQQAARPLAVDLSNDRLYYERTSRPKGYQPDGKVVPFETPTPEGLRRHAERFG